MEYSLKPSAQCAKAASKANQVLGQMARSLTYRDKYTWVKLYKQYVRYHLEYAVQSWSPWTEADIDLLESVQKRAIRMVSGLNSNVYEEQLKEVNLTTLYNRRQRLLTHGITCLIVYIRPILLMTLNKSMIVFLLVKLCIFVLMCYILDLLSILTLVTR